MLTFTAFDLNNVLVSYEMNMNLTRHSFQLKKNQNFLCISAIYLHKP